jgi:hypothetical protein
MQLIRRLYIGSKSAYQLVISLQLLAFLEMNKNLFQVFKLAQGTKERDSLCQL